MKNKKIITATVIFALFFFVFPFDLNNLFSRNANADIDDKFKVIEEPTIWDLNNAPVIIDNQEYTFKSDLIIKEGVKIIFKNSSKIKVEGDFIVEGDKDHPVIFEGIEDVGESGYNYHISARGDFTHVENAVFKKGGGNQCTAYDQKGLFKKVIAQSCIPVAALSVRVEEDDIFNLLSSHFSDNYHALNIFRSSSSSGIYLRDNIFENNKQVAVYTNSESFIDAPDNCWMRPSGPTHSDNPNGLGERIIGNVNYSGWNKCGTDHKPVFILPGIGGSWNWKVMLSENNLISHWDFSPTNHFYNELVNSFKEKGFQKGKDLQIVHYDWRQDNHQSMEEFLKLTIKETKEISFDKNYDIVAHSMGGLVALDYIYDNSYNDEIDKLILLGTPVFGASKSYAVWEGGALPEDWTAMRYYFNILKAKPNNWGKDNYDLIHEYIPSAKQLMPVYNYVVKNENQEQVNFWEMEEQNDYINGLFGKIYQNMSNFRGENILLVEGTNVATSKDIFVDEYDSDNSDKLWKDGKPNPYPLEKESMAGDGTVLNESSDLFFLNGVQKKSLEKVSHTQLPTKSITDIHDFLGIGPPNGTYALVTENQLVFVLACPIDTKVIAPDGKYIDQNENQIGNAYYYSDGREDGYKIIEIQDPQEGEYQLELTGNGNGEYDVFVYKTDGEETKEAEISGEIKEDEELTYSVEENGESLIIGQVSQADITPPAILIYLPEENKEYLKNEILDINYEITDDISERENIIKNIFLDNGLLTASKIDLSLQSLGKHEFKIEAIDEAGNTNLKEINFLISTNINALTDNVNHYYELGLIKNWKIKKYLNVKLRSIERLMKFKQQIENHPRMYKKFKKRIIKKIDRFIKRQINRTIWQVKKNKKIKRNIDKNTRGLIIEQLKYIKNNR